MILAVGFRLGNINHPKLDSFFVVVPAALIVTNTLLCTLLIVGKIWYMQCRLRQVTNGTMALSSYKGAVALIIESGALYATSQLLCLTLYHVKNPGLPVLLNMHIPLIGILPTLIIVLVHFNMVPGSHTTEQYTATFVRHSITLDTIHSTATMMDGRTIPIHRDDIGYREKGEVVDPLGASSTGEVPTRIW